MALSGNQAAYLQARSGIARSGATRSNYFLPNVGVWIGSQGTYQDFSRYILHNAWSVNLNINDEIDTASISLLLPAGNVPPLTRSLVKITLGSSTNPIFAGIIMVVQSTQEQTQTGPRVWCDLSCVDFTALLDAHLVLANYPAQSATITILDIVNRFAPAAGISTAGVAPNMPVIPGFQVIHERPSTVLRRLTNQVGGGFYLDANRVLRAWSSAIPSPIQDTAPVPLVSPLPKTLKTWRVTRDATQQRTRVFVEGVRSETLIGVPVGQPTEMVVGDAAPLHAWSAGTPGNMLRLGAQYVQATNIIVPVADAANNPPGTVLTFALDPASNGLQVADTSMFPNDCWLRVGDQILWCHKVNAAAMTTPASGPGSIKGPAGVGTPVTLLPGARLTGLDRAYNPLQPLVWFTGAPTFTQPLGTPVVLLSWQQDNNAANKIALAENSDGYYEHIVQDGRFRSEGAAARASAELANFAEELVTYEWETEDLAAVPGVIQHLAGMQATPGNPFDVRITNVAIRPIATNYPPRRVVRASPIQAASVLDVWVEDSR